MLLTITYRGNNTQDLGFLLHKNPARPQAFELAFGKAYIFYPKVTDKETTAALLLDLDPLDLAKGKAASGEKGLFDYVNDRPYVASSFLSNAMIQTFGTAMNGRCDKRPELVQTDIDLEAKVYMLPVRGDKVFLKEVFEPLGYQVSYETFPVDEEYPEWGESDYVNLTVRGNVRMSELLNHLYVLIPVFDASKHYYISENEIDKLLKHGKGWLEGHPAKNKIVRRYFAKARSYAKDALEQMGNYTEEERDMSVSLDRQRLEEVRDAVTECKPSSVLDLGCGEGKLLALLLDTPIETIAGCDVSMDVLHRASERLHMDDMPQRKKERLTLFQGSMTCSDARFRGYDVVCAVEVIEHIEPEWHDAAERVLFELAAPETVIITTPNSEYNIHYALEPDSLRHEDHRFEWTRDEFALWCNTVCGRYGYEVQISGIGDTDEHAGQPTQMAVFRKQRQISGENTQSPH